MENVKQSKKDGTAVFKINNRSVKQVRIFSLKQKTYTFDMSLKEKAGSGEFVKH